MSISLALLERYGLANHLRWFIKLDEDANPDYISMSYEVVFAEALAHIVGSGPFSALRPRGENFGTSGEESVLAHSPRGLVKFDLPTRVAAMIDMFSNPSCNREYLCRMNSKLSDKCLEEDWVGLAAVLYEAEKTTWDNEYKIMNLKKKEDLKRQLRECLGQSDNLSESKF